MAATDEPVSWGSFSDRFLDELAAWIGARRVLEVFAGNGLLASRLAAEGTDVLATTLFAGHDGHDRGMHFDVVEMEATEAVLKFGADRDVLLMSWPTATEAATKAVLRWGPERPVIFIGEVTRHDLGFSGLGGCASDLFFELTEEALAFGSYEPRNGLERAGVRYLSLEAVRKWTLQKKPDQDFRP